MTLTAGILSVLFVLALVTAFFFLGMRISNLYHRHEQEAVTNALRRNKETMHENYLMSERERWWNAYSAPTSKAGSSSKAQVIPVEFTDKLSTEGKATMRIN